MGQLLDWATSIKYGRQGWPQVVSYLKDGDPATLAELAAMKDINTGALDDMGRCLGPPKAMEDEHRRGLHILAATRNLEPLAQWLLGALMNEEPEQDVIGMVVSEIGPHGVGLRELLAMVSELEHHDETTSAGRALLALSDDDLVWCVAHSDEATENKLDFLLAFAPERLPLVIEHALDPEEFEEWKTLLEEEAGRDVKMFVPKVPTTKSLRERYFEALEQYRADPERHRSAAVRAAREMIASGLEWESDAAEAMRLFGTDILDAVTTYLKTPGKVLHTLGLSFQQTWLAYKVVEILGRDGMPALLAHLEVEKKEDWSDFPYGAVQCLIDVRDESVADVIREELERGLKEKTIDYQGRFSALELADRWGPERVSEQIWPLARDSSKKIRDMVVPVLAKLGDAEVRPKALAMLEEKKADLRETAVALLAALKTPEALDALEARRDEEPDEDVRDAIMRVLDANGRPAANPDLKANLARVSESLKSPVEKWADEGKLPELKDTDGKPLGMEVTRYLLLRQSRAKEIAPDIEVRGLYDRIEARSGAEFGLRLLEKYIQSGGNPPGRWALTVAGRLGDARVVPVLVKQVDVWIKSNRLKMAEYAVQALALVRDEATLAALDGLTRRYRSKPKNIPALASEVLRSAAETQGISLDELGDRIVPTLGFQGRQPRVLACGSKTVEVSIGPDFKLRYLDPAAKKRLKSLPSSASKEVKEEMKSLGAQLREAVKAQTARLEDQLVRQRRWPVERWRELFLEHTLMFPFTARLVWGHYDEKGTLRGTFRTLEDGSLTDVEDTPFELGKTGVVGLVHPLDLNDEALRAWKTHLADYEVEPPFSQMDRPVVRVPEEQRSARRIREFHGTKLNARTFKGRAERLGWSRGPVCDNGSVYAYTKKSPAGVEAVVGLECMSVQPWDDLETTLEDVGFFRLGEWTGFYYDPLPKEENDPRLIPLGEVPPVVYSEVLGDLRRICGQSTAQADSEED